MDTTISQVDPLIPHLRIRNKDQEMAFDADKLTKPQGITSIQKMSAPKMPKTPKTSMVKGPKAPTLKIKKPRSSRPIHW